MKNAKNYRLAKLYLVTDVGGNEEVGFDFYPLFHSTMPEFWSGFMVYPVHELRNAKNYSARIVPGGHVELNELPF